MNSKTNLMTVIALVIGILSIPFSCLYAWMGLIAGLIGIILALICRRRLKNTMAIAALVCAILGLVISLGNMTIMGAFIWMAFL